VPIDCKSVGICWYQFVADLLMRQNWALAMFAAIVVAGRITFSLQGFWSAHRINAPTRTASAGDEKEGPALVKSGPRQSASRRLHPRRTYAT
jgi:hypothetical protein